MILIVFIFVLMRPVLQGNIAFRKGDFAKAMHHYEVAHDIEPELPHYQLNLAAAYLKLSKYVPAISLFLHCF